MPSHSLTCLYICPKSPVPSSPYPNLYPCPYIQPLMDAWVSTPRNPRLPTSQIPVLSAYIPNSHIRSEVDSNEIERGGDTGGYHVRHKGSRCRIHSAWFPI